MFVVDCGAFQPDKEPLKNSPAPVAPFLLCQGLGRGDGGGQDGRACVLDHLQRTPFRTHLLFKVSLVGGGKDIAPFRHDDNNSNYDYNYYWRIIIIAVPDDMRTPALIYYHDEVYRRPEECTSGRCRM